MITIHIFPELRFHRPGVEGHYLRVTVFKGLVLTRNIKQPHQSERSTHGKFQVLMKIWIVQWDTPAWWRAVKQYKEYVYNISVSQGRSCMFAQQLLENVCHELARVNKDIQLENAMVLVMSPLVAIREDRWKPGSQREYLQRTPGKIQTHN